MVDEKGKVNNPKPATGEKGGFVHSFLYLLSLLPLRVLFIFSDIAYLLLYHVAGYRKKVVFSNLALAFPNKTNEERRQIARRFYRNFTDNFMETVKLLSADTKYLNEHFTGDYSVFEQVYHQGKKSQVHLGHIFNWEMANNTVAANIPQKLLTLYMPIEAKVFDRLFLKLRTRTGAVMLPATSIRSALLPWRNTLYSLVLVADQSPAVPSNAYWVPFFGRPTPFLKAPENGARVSNVPVIFSYFVKRKRGYYQVFFDLVEESPASLPKGELTKRFAQYLEQAIVRNPDMWLWSHRRWKWEWKEEYGPVV